MAKEPNDKSLAIEGAKDGLWDWNLLTNEVYFSSQWKRQLGYQDHELKNELNTWETRVHPNDIKQALSDIQNNIDKNTIVDDLPVLDLYNINA